MQRNRGGASRPPLKEDKERNSFTRQGNSSPRESTSAFEMSSEGSSSWSKYEHRRRIHSLAVHPSQRYLAFGSMMNLHLLRILENDKMTEISQVVGSSKSLDFHIVQLTWNQNDDSLLVAVYSDGTVRIFRFTERPVRPNVSGSSANLPSTPINRQLPKTQHTNTWCSESGHLTLECQVEFSSTPSSIAASRVSWHPTDSTLLAVGCNDGTTRVVEIRPSGGGVRLQFTLSTSERVVIRDVQYNPLASDYIADCTDRGFCRIWDCRSPKYPVVNTKVARYAVLTIAWHPSELWTLATRCTDKLVKIWSVDSNMLCYDVNQSNSVNSVTSQQAYDTMSIGSHGMESAVLNNYLMIHKENKFITTAPDTKKRVELYRPRVIHPQFNELSKIMWYEEEGLECMLAILCGPSESTQLVNFYHVELPNLPIITLRSAEAASCMAWISVPTNSLSSIANGISARINTLNDAAANSSSVSNSSSNEKNSRRGSPRSVQPNSSKVNPSSANTSPKHLNLNKQEMAVHIVIGTSKGHLVIENPRLVMSCYSRFSPTVSAVSSQGIVAFHKGSTSEARNFLAEFMFPRAHGSPLNRPFSITGTDTNNSNGAGSNSGTRSTAIDMHGQSLDVSSIDLARSVLAGEVHSVTHSRSMELSNGYVWVAMPDFTNLEEARNVRLLGTTAQASVFDPALITLLAKSYSMPQSRWVKASRGETNEEEDTPSPPPHNTTPNPSQPDTGGEIFSPPSTPPVESNTEVEPVVSRSKSGRDSEEELTTLEKIEREFVIRQTLFESAAASCQSNAGAALRAGLKCRASVWSTLLTLLPPPIYPRPEIVNQAVQELDGIKSSNPDREQKVGLTTPEISQEALDAVCLRLFFCRERHELDFALELLAKLLLELLNSADSQHFVVMREILRRAGLLPLVEAAVSNSGLNSLSSKKKTRDADDAGRDSITTNDNDRKSGTQSVNKSTSNDEEDDSIFPQVKVREMYLSYLDLLMRLRLFNQACELIANAEDTFIAKMNRKDIDLPLRCGRCRRDLHVRPSFAPTSATVWCQSCRACVSRCIICTRPVTSFLQMCPVCCHGGHMDCMAAWHSMYSTCASGCGHNCCDEGCHTSQSFALPVGSQPPSDFHSRRFVQASLVPSTLHESPLAKSGTISGNEGLSRRRSEPGLRRRLFMNQINQLTAQSIDHNPQ